MRLERKSIFGVTLIFNVAFLVWVIYDKIPSKKLQKPLEDKNT